MVGVAFIGDATAGDGAALADGEALCFLLAGELLASANGLVKGDIVSFEDDDAARDVAVAGFCLCGVVFVGVVFVGVRLRFTATGSFARRISAALMSMLLLLRLGADSANGVLLAASCRWRFRSLFRLQTPLCFVAFTTVLNPNRKRTKCDTKVA